MRVLLTVHAAADPDAGISGVTLRLAEAYRERGHETRVLSFSDLPDRVPATVKALVFPGYVAAQVGKLSARGGFDVLDASTGDAWLCRLPEQGSHRPLVVTRSHGLEHTLDAQTRASAAAGGAPLSWKYPRYTGGYRLHEVRRSLVAADLALFLNHDDLDHATGRLGVPPERAVVVRNGVPSSYLGRPAPAPTAGPLRIAVVGAYSDRKGVAHAAAALNRLLPLHPEWAVTFLGGGVPVEHVHADYDPSVRHQVSVVPSYDNGSLPDLLDGHHVHLFPTLREGAPLALLETMACGLAPVVSRVPGPIEVVTDGVDGLLVPPGDVHAIENALERLDADRALLDVLRAGAHRTAQSYGWDAIADEQLELYREWIAR